MQKGVFKIQYIFMIFKKSQKTVEYKNCQKLPHPYQMNTHNPYTYL